MSNKTPWYEFQSRVYIFYYSFYKEVPIESAVIVSKNKNGNIQFTSLQNGVVEYMEEDLSWEDIDDIYVVGLCVAEIGENGNYKIDLSYLYDIVNEDNAKYDKILSEIKRLKLILNRQNNET